MQILEKPIKESELLSNSKITFDGEMVKGVVDIKTGQLSIDADLHADLERLMLDNGSSQYDLWGINLWPGTDELVEFDSMINIRPAQNNRSRSVEDEETRNKILEVVAKWITP